MKRLVLWLLLLGLTAACAPRVDSPLSPPATPTPQVFSGTQAYTWVEKQCALGARVTGTEANRQAGDQFIAALRADGWQVQEQTFTYRDTPVRNILAWKGDGPAVLIGAHYDSRRSADQEDPSVPVMGANDGASGVAVLLELARVLDFHQVPHRVYLAFFDAEDNGQLDGWDWCIGSRYMADHWGENGEPPLSAMVLVDMIGDADQQVYYERNSDAALQKQIWQVAAQLGYGDRIIARPGYRMIDDHVPFLQHGIPSVDMIDFDYPYWHTTQDTADKVSPASLEAIGRTLQAWLEQPAP